MSHRLEIILIILAVGWMFGHPYTPQPFQFYITITLVLGIFIHSIHCLIQHGKIAIWSNLCQPMLFVILYMQIYTYYGAEHYTFPNNQYVPNVWEWVEFTGAHILRASDILDIFEEYNIRLQTIQHSQTYFVAGFVIIMHWMVDIFLIALLVQWLSKPLQTWWSKIEEKKRKRFIGINTASTLLLVVATLTMTIQPNNRIDWFFWPVDNFIRVFDVGDTFQLFDIRLHSLPQDNWISVPSLLFRVLLAYYISNYGSVLRLRIIGGRGLTVEELIEHLGSPTANVRESAYQTLEKIAPDWRNTPAAHAALLQLVASLSNSNIHIRKAASWALVKIGPVAVPHLMKHLYSDAHDLVVESLEKIDPHWSQKQKEASSGLLSHCSHLVSGAYCLARIYTRWAWRKVTLQDRKTNMATKKSAR